MDNKVTYIYNVLHKLNQSNDINEERKKELYLLAIDKIETIDSNYEKKYIHDVQFIFDQLKK